MKFNLIKTVSFFIVLVSCFTIIYSVSSCSNDGASEINKVNEEIIDEQPLSYLNRNNIQEESLKRFAEKHVSLGNEIIMLLDNEDELNFDNFPYRELESSGDEEAFKSALSNAGVVNYEEVYNLLLSQSQNAADFNAENREFKELDVETRNLLITDAIKVAISENPITFMPPSGHVDTQLGWTCYQQYLIDRGDCADDALLNTGILMSGCWFATPLACAVGGAGVIATAAVCNSRAKRDYAACMN